MCAPPYIVTIYIRGSLSAVRQDDIRGDQTGTEESMRDTEIEFGAVSYGRTVGRFVKSLFRITV